MNIPAKPLKKGQLPKRILAIRLQAMGDLVITLPYLQALREQLPASVQIDLLTRKEVDSIPRNLILTPSTFITTI
jgi:heptosyltransferase-2